MGLEGVRLLFNEDDGHETRRLVAWQRGETLIVEEATAGPSTLDVYGMGRHTHRVIARAADVERYLVDRGYGPLRRRGLEAFFRAHPSLLDFADGLDWAGIPYTYASEGPMSTSYRTGGTDGGMGERP